MRKLIATTNRLLARKRMPRAMTLAVVIVAIACAIATAAAQPSSDAEAVAEKDVPRAVALRMRCKAPSGVVMRRRFAGGFVFSQTCTGDTGPQERLVFADDRDGANARLLQFHRPEGRRVSALGNVTFSADGEIAGTVGRLSRRICRAEGRWRMEGKAPSPGLVYWRQTRDCEGKTGWQVMVNRRAPQSAR